MTEQTIFLAALDLADPAERTAYLDRTCGPNEALRRQVEALLAAHDRSGFLDAPALEQMAAGRPGDRPTVTVDPNAPAGPDTPTLASPDSTADRDDDLSFLNSPTRADSIGRLDRYEVLEVLGRGGFGTVLRAFDERLHRVVAIKVLAPQLAASGTARARFNREAKAGAAVRDDHVVNIYEVSPKDEPVPFLVMEYVAGQTLQQKLDRTGPLSVPEVLRIGSQVAKGLAAAHATGLIHRDVKPSNILLENGVERVKLTDFGLARAADDASISHSGVVAGTPQYMAPEQAHGEKIDHRADLFSLGSVLYAMCTGRPPFRASTTMAVLKRVCEEEPRPVREINPEVPEWLAAVIAKLHAKKPEERFQSAKEVADLLQQHLVHLKSPDTVPAPTPVQPSAPARRPAAPPRRRFRWVVAAAVPLALLALGAAWFGRPALLYLSDQGELELAPQDGLVQVIVLQNPEGVIDGNKLRPLVTDWLDMRTAHTLKLPPGKYQLNAGTWPAGTRIVHWEVTTSGPLGGNRLLVPSEGGSVLVTVERGRRTIVRPEIGRALPPDHGVPADSVGWVQLFNGKDLTGWKTHPDQPGTWEVRDGILTGSTRQSYLFTERGDYKNFHLRAEVNLNAGGDSGIRFRAPFALRKGAGAWQVSPAGGYEAEISNSPTNPIRTGSVWKVMPEGAPITLHGVHGKSPIRPDEWFTLEVIADRNRLVTRINGQQVADCEDSRNTYPTGHIALQVFSPQTVVRFRKVEVKELPASPPEVPRRAADVLPFMAGSWKVEKVEVEPKPPADLARAVGYHVCDYVADGKFLRQRGAFETGTVEPAVQGPLKAGSGMPLILYSYDPAKDELAHWGAWPNGTAYGPVLGRFDPDSQSLLWLKRHPGGIQSTHQFNFVDSNKLTTRVYAQDPDGKILWEVHLTFTRLKGPVTPSHQPTDPTRPEEMKVLDRLVGEWRSETTVSVAGPDTKVDTVRVKAEPVLGGRFVEKFETDEATGASDYTLSWFDADAKKYRTWFFNHSGTVTEFAGTWNEATKTLTWNSADGRLEGRWTFKSDDLREFRHLVKDADGKVLSETAGVSRRTASGWVPLFNGRDLAGWKPHPDQPGDWKVEDGVLVGRGGPSHLFTDRGDFADFHLRAQVQINQTGDSGVWFRTAFGLPAVSPVTGIRYPNGYEVQVIGYPNGDEKNRHTGSILPLAPAPKALAAAGEWFTLELIARGGHFVTKVNGQVAAEADAGPDAPRAGHIALQCGGSGRATTVRFRNIEVRQLPPAPAGPPRAVVPFDAAKAKELQDAWAKHLGVPVEMPNSIGMSLRLIPPGEFTMGSTGEESEAVRKQVKDWAVPAVEAEGPPRKAAVPRPYYLGATEVTLGQFRRFVTKTGYKTEAERNGNGGRALAEGDRIEQKPEWTWRQGPWATDDDRPVVQVSLDDAKAFCKWLSETEGLTYTLPTEEQWEFACRAGTTTYWPTGNDPAGVLETDWVVGSSNFDLHRVGRKKANPFGLYDMLGNAEELCEWERDGQQLSRGGHANLEPWLCRSASRWTFPAGEPYYRRGFRVAVVGDLRPKPPAPAKAADLWRW
jgi:formylglycine-generating enzyme required for sulfatase activity